MPAGIPAGPQTQSHMLKQLFIKAFLCAGVLTACSCGPNQRAMDCENVAQIVASVYAEQIDTTQYHVYNISWNDSQLNNTLAMIEYRMLGPDNKPMRLLKYFDYSPARKIEPIAGGDVSIRKVKFDRMEWIRPGEIKPATIVACYQAAKQMIPEGYEFISVADHTIVRKGDGLSHVFTIATDGKGVSTSRMGKSVRVTEYPAFRFRADDAGNVTIQ